MNNRRRLKIPDSKRYVVGFLFTEDYSSVLLVEKNRPEWQKGRLNGIGGHIEIGEVPDQAIAREFQEETGLIGIPWKEFCYVYSGNYEIFFYTANKCTGIPYSVTDEIVNWFSSKYLPESIVSNLEWLIPMAKYKLSIHAEIYHPNEEC